MKSLTKLLTLGAISASFVGMLYADPDAGGAPDAKSMSVADMQRQSAALDSQMKEDLRQVLHLKQVANKQRDVIKVNCVNDKLLVIKAQTNIADGIGHNLQASLARGGDDRGDLFTKYRASALSVASARDSANGCVGEHEIVTQSANSEIHAPVIPDDPVQTNPFDYHRDIEAPAYASPFN